MLWEFLATGGFVMLLIVLCSLVAVACMIIAAIQLRERVVLPVTVIAQLKSLPQYAVNGDILPLQQFLERDGSLLSRLASMAVSGQYPTKQECTEVIAARAKEELHHLERGIPYLEVMVTVAPLLGLLGTVWGMIDAFANIALADGLGNPESLAAGISQALVTTAAGLAVAIPTQAAYYWFRSRIDFFAHSTEDLYRRISEMLSAKPAMAEKKA